MKRWVVGGAAVLAAAAVVGWYGATRRGPEVVVNAPATPEPAPTPTVPAPAEPAVLARVVDVADIDPLLDPPAIPTAEGAAGPVLIAVGYEEPAPAPVVPRDVPPIPPAASDDDDIEVAPMPREAPR